VSDTKRLKDTLLKLASESSLIEDDWRRIAGQDDGEPLALILAEIDETQLPRMISLRNDRGDILRLEAANRRLRQLISPAPADLSAFARLFDVSLSEPSDEVVETIGKMFHVFGNGCRTFWVRTENLSNSADSNMIGISAAALARAWSIALTMRPEIGPQQAFEEFVTTTLTVSEAWVRTEDGAVVVTSSPDLHASWLEDCRSVDWTGYLAAHGDHTLVEDAPTLCILSSDAMPDTHLLLAASGLIYVVMLVRSAKLSEISANWRKLGL